MVTLKPLEEMTPIEMVEELKMRREYDKEQDKASEELGEKVEEMERELNVLRFVLSHQVVGVMLAPKPLGETDA